MPTFGESRLSSLFETQRAFAVIPDGLGYVGNIDESIFVFGRVFCAIFTTGGKSLARVGEYASNGCGVNKSVFGFLKIAYTSIIKPARMRIGAMVIRVVLEMPSLCNLLTLFGRKTRRMSEWTRLVRKLVCCRASAVERRNRVFAYACGKSIWTA